MECLADASFRGSLQHVHVCICVCGYLQVGERLMQDTCSAGFLCWYFILQGICSAGFLCWYFISSSFLGTLLEKMLCAGHVLLVSYELLPQWFHEPRNAVPSFALRFQGIGEV